jgi:malonyl-CoA/methylmalonyl-CoA synthetase
VLCPPGRDFVVALLACWQAGGVAVPMHPAHPVAELAYVRDDARLAAVIASPELAELAARLTEGTAVKVVDVDSVGRAGVLPAVGPDRRALMVHTSGTTGRPKGVVHTHRSVTAMVDGLLDAWAWSAADRTLLVLPLNHVHGLVNVVLCALAAGATLEAPGGFDALAVWDRLASAELTIFMAVPTVYARLVAAHEEADAATQAAWSAGARAARLMVSGSAALPVSTLVRWQEITGQVLLERYGMSEVGMALSNTLARRVPGHVGDPLPGVEVRVVDDTGEPVPPGEPGELLVRGPQVFGEYWDRPGETEAAFLDGWFRTGDVAVLEPGGYRLLGRSSVDILKTGGEKVSALEIEELYRTHPAVGDCAVVGVPDAEWGERVCAAIQRSGGEEASGADLRAWGRERLAMAKVPSRFAFVDELPRNALGKVVKRDVAALFGPEPRPGP